MHPDSNNWIQTLGRLCRSRATLRLILLLAGLLIPVSAFAQDAPSPSAPEQNAEQASPTDPKPLPQHVPTQRNPVPAESGRVVQAVGPDVFYVPDNEGNLIPVPAGISIEDFQRLYQIEKRLATPATPPQYNVEESKISGSVEGGRADLTVEMTVQIQSDQPIRIPLGLSNAIPRKIPSSNDDRRVTIRFEEDAGGYVAWIEAEKGTKQQIDFGVLVPVQRVANQTTLNLETPHATVSNVELTVPEKQPTVAHSENAHLQSNESLESGGSKLRLVGGAGVLRLSWSETSQDSTTSASSSLDVDSTLVVRFGGPDAMRTEATFRVQSFGQPVDTVRIRLPANSKVVSTSGSPYQVTVEELNDSELQVAVFQLPEPTRNRFTLQLSVEQRVDETEDRASQRLAAGGFFVEGAFRHLGHLALAIEGDWLPRWDESASVRPTTEVPPELQSEDEATVFRYYQQPFALPLSVVRKLTRTSVASTFVYDVQPDRVELRALLKVTVHGAPTQSLVVDFPGWEVYDIDDGVPIKDDELVLQNNPLRIPFARPRRGRFNLEIRARRKIVAPNNAVALQLPTVRSASAAQPIVVAQPADNVELNLRTGESSKLVPARVPMDLSLSAGEQSILCHRLVDSSDQLQVVYDFRLKPQSVQASVTSTVNIREDVANVEQQIALDVRNAPLDRIVLRVPVPDPEQWSINDLEFAIGGSVLTPNTDDELATALAAKAEASGSQADFEFPIFELPFGAIGNVSATVRYSVSPQTEQDDWDIPLTLPEVDQIGNHEAVVHSPEKTSVRIADSRWSFAADGRRDKTNVLVATAEGRVDTLTAEVNSVDDDDVSSTIVQRAFIQTWSTHSSRRDLGIFRFNSNEDTLAIKLPSGASELRAVIDKQSVTLAQRNNAIFEVDLAEIPKGEHVLELSYVFQEPLGSFGSLVELPEIVDANWTQIFYWQLVLPERTHLIREPAGLISANHWGWRGISWGRTPQHEQEWFEQWVGSSTQPFAPPVDSTNRYLFTTFTGVGQLKISTASRNMIAAVLIGSAFALGFMFISLDWMRRPFSILAVACAAILAGLAAPTSVLAVAPPVVFGFCLVGLVPLLRKFVAANTERSLRTVKTPLQRPPSTSIRSTSLRDSKTNPGPNATTATLQVSKDA